MHMIACLSVGLIAGFLAGKFVVGHGGGVLGDMLVGLIGAFIAGVVYTSTHYRHANLWGETMTSSLGAVLLLTAAHVIYLTVMPRRERT